jgi:hypothetical protein
MRITISLDDSVHRQAKVLAARSGRTLGAVVEDALREALATSGDDYVRPDADA